MSCSRTTLKSTFRLLFIIALLPIAIATYAPPASGAEFEAGMRYVVVTPKTNDFEGGSLQIATSGGFAATAELFTSESLSAHLAATLVNPEAILFPSTPPPSNVDLTTLGIDTYALTGRWYFRPGANTRPFAGAGVSYVVIGDLNDRFGDAIEVIYDPKWAPVVEGGVRYQLFARVAIDVSVSWMPLSADSKIVRNDDPRVTLPATIHLDPLTFSAGAAWRF